MCSHPLTCVTNKSTNLKHMLSLVAGCLALRTRNGRLKNSFNPGGTLPTHPVGPKKWTCIDMRGLLKWPNTCFTSSLYSYLLYSKFWFTLHLRNTRQELPYTWKTKTFSICMHLLGSCFNINVSMLRKFGGNWMNFVVII